MGEGRRSMLGEGQKPPKLTSSLKKTDSRKRQHVVEKNAAFVILHCWRYEQLISLQERSVQDSYVAACCPPRWYTSEDKNFINLQCSANFPNNFSTSSPRLYFWCAGSNKHCSRFFCLTPLSRPDHYIYRHTDLFFSNLSFNHTHSFLPEDCLALIWVWFGWVFDLMMLQQRSLSFENINSPSSQPRKAHWNLIE